MKSIRVPTYVYIVPLKFMQQGKCFAFIPYFENVINCSADEKTL